MLDRAGAFYHVPAGVMVLSAVWIRRYSASYVLRLLARRLIAEQLGVSDSPHSVIEIGELASSLSFRPTICAANSAKATRLIANTSARMLRYGATVSWRARVGGATTAPALRIRGLFVGAGELDAGLLGFLRRPLPRSVLRCDLIHADMAAELALVSSGMTIPLSRAIFSANDICAGLAGLEPGSPGGSPSAFLRACWSRNARQIVPDFV